MHVSVIMPCYNERATLPFFHQRLTQMAERDSSASYEFLYVNDGSSDDTGDLLNTLADEDERVKVIHLARNCGHQTALTAGMDFASGDYIVTLDADLQDPPEIIPELLCHLNKGYDLVHTQRLSREGESFFKRGSAWLFYQFLGYFTKTPLIANSGDFRAFTRPVLLVIRRFREPHRYLRGLFPLLGFRQTIVPYHREKRHAGDTKFTLPRMTALALNGILSSSTALLKAVLWIALLLWMTSLGFLVKACIGHFVFHHTVPGWTSLVVLLTFFTGLNLFSLSIIGMYVSRIFEQGQQRPLYWCSDLRNVNTSHLAEDPSVSHEVILSLQLHRPVKS